MGNTKTQLLDDLFTEWARRDPNTARLLCRDGIVREECYDTAAPKTLFVSKEPNNPQGLGFDFRDCWANDPVKYGFSHRLSEWAFGVQNGFPPLSVFDSNESHKRESMQAIAFMNLKKVGGSGTADSDSIKSLVTRDEDLLRRQIEIIAPDVLIGCIGFERDVWRLLFPQLEFQPSGFDVSVARVNGIRIIDFYHPSYRVPRAMSYTLLASVYQSRLFESL